MSRWHLPLDPLLALQAGNAVPFEDFVRLHARTLVAFFRQQGAGLTRAEDLAQEVFLKLYQSAERYEAKERFAAYCFRLARNTWIDDCRRSSARSEPGVERESVVAEPPGEPFDPGAALALEEEDRRVADLLAKLAPTHREVFELAVLGELDYGEIGALLSIPVGTVKSRMFHAVRRLRAVWDRRLRREGVA